MPKCDECLLSISIIAPKPHPTYTPLSAVSQWGKNVSLNRSFPCSLVLSAGSVCAETVPETMTNNKRIILLISYTISVYLNNLFFEFNYLQGEFLL